MPLPASSLSLLLLSPRRLAIPASICCYRQFQTSQSLNKNSGKPRLKTIPVSNASQRVARGSAAASAQALLNLTPEALKKKIEERNAAEAADPRRGRQPEAECHLRDLFEPRRLPLVEILRRHREFRLSRDAGQSERSAVIRLPHALPESLVRQHTVIAFCSSPEMAEDLKAKGAMDAGGADLLGKLETGVYIQENFDYVICHPDFWPSLLKARKLLKDAMPAQKSPQISEDMESALMLYKYGIPAKLTQAGDLPDRAQCRVPFGLLDWPDYNLNENLSAIVTGLLNEKPKKSNREFIMSVSVTCPPSDELFLLDWKPYTIAADSSSTAAHTVAPDTADAVAASAS
uniref:Ribosomal protein n=1 Tax=Macrostomum lignano TaxID=282301 RepID=A0A1I8J2X7_9PLAT